MNVSWSTDHLLCLFCHFSDMSLLKTNNNKYVYCSRAGILHATVSVKINWFIVIKLCGVGRCRFEESKSTLLLSTFIEIYFIIIQSCNNTKFEHHWIRTRQENTTFTFTFVTVPYDLDIRWRSPQLVRKCVYKAHWRVSSCKAWKILLIELSLQPPGKIKPCNC